MNDINDDLVQYLEQEIDRLLKSRACFTLSGQEEFEILSRLLYIVNVDETGGYEIDEEVSFYDD